MMELILFTNYFPFETSGSEHIFVNTELRFLSNHFKKIRIVPAKTEGKAVHLDTDKYTLDTSLARELKKGRLHKLSSFLKWQGSILEVFKHVHLKSIHGLLFTVRDASIAQSVKSWAQKNISSNSPSLLYTYWASPVTLGLCSFRDENSLTKVVTRVHGYDLYQERYRKNYIPWHRQILSSPNTVYTVCKQAKEYIKEKYGIDNNIKLSYLGTFNPHHKVRRSTDTKLRVLSCSHINKVKNVPFIAETLKAFCLKNSISVTWTHIGNGIEMNSVTRALKDRPGNLKVELLGELTSEEVYDYYRSNPVDLFIHLSHSEGLPVVLQEAASFGIPIMSSDVGGCSEIVDSTNGFLLSIRPDTAETVGVLEKFVKLSNEVVDSMREASFLKWSKHFNAEKNYSIFSSELKHLASRNDE
ncbi:glycosyltransferase [Hahella sp. NBU794]|uniref:glycosyltransferase n=1 Tax=Hahella sp. NBU794 TaxID=3422590 RepID=UPI003D6DF756